MTMAEPSKQPARSLATPRATLLAAAIALGLLLTCNVAKAHADEAPNPEPEPNFKATLSASSATYNGKIQEPVVTVTSAADETPLPESAYTVEWSAQPKNAGAYQVTVRGNSDQGATGTCQLDFTVKPKALTQKSPKLAYTSKVYANYAYTPSVTVRRTLDGTVRTLKKGADYTVSYEASRTKAGTHKVTITGIGNFTGAVTCDYTITRRPLSSFSAKLSTTVYRANNTKRTPSVTVYGRMNHKDVTLKRDRDYTVTYRNNVKPGTATVTIAGKGNFKGTKTLSFRLTSAYEAALYSKIANQGSATKYIIAVSCSRHRVGIYQGSKGSWKQIKYWKCTNGAPSTPTRKGTFTVKSRGKAFGSGYTCWYWTQWSGNYLFHSVLYNPGSMTSVQDGRLGIAASHGCIRLSLENARWIYQNIPRGTKVVVW